LAVNQRTCATRETERSERGRRERRCIGWGASVLGASRAAGAGGGGGGLAGCSGLASFDGCTRGGRLRSGVCAGADGRPGVAL
jgi:hypothetical protein